MAPILIHCVTLGTFLHEYFLPFFDVPHDQQLREVMANSVCYTVTEVSEVSEVSGLIPVREKEFHKQVAQGSLVVKTSGV